MEKIVADALHRTPADNRPVLAWPLACGSVVAERTRAVSFSGGVLTVEVSDAGWKRELATLAGRYLAILNRHAGHRVDRIEFITRR
jgi:hypothetical protein